MLRPRRRRRHDPEEPPRGDAPAAAAPPDGGVLGGLTPDDAVDLDTLVVSVAEDLGLAARLAAPGVLELSAPVPARVGLGGLAQRTRGVPRPAWPDLVAAELSRLLTSLRRQPDHGDWSRVRPLVRARAEADDWLPAGSGALTRPLAPGLVEVLALSLSDAGRRAEPPGETPGGRVEDAGEIVSVVPRAALRTWPLTPAQAFAAGRAATHADEPVRVTALDAPVEVHALEGGLLTLGHLPCLSEHVDLPATGALVALPTRRALLVHPLRGPDAQDAVGVVLALAERLHALGPGPVTDRLYWRLSCGDLLHLPHRRTPDGLLLTPPRSFLEVVERLRGSGGGAGGGADG